MMIVRAKSSPDTMVVFFQLEDARGEEHRAAGRFWSTSCQAFITSFHGIQQTNTIEDVLRQTE